MKLEISQCIKCIKGYYKDYYLRIGGAIDYGIAEILDIPIEEYNQILIDNGAHIIFYNDKKTAIGYEFKRKKDPEKAIKVLEPYLILAKLLK